MPETKSVFVPTRTEYEEILENKFVKLLNQHMPKVVRQANRKPYLSTKDVKELFGISYRMQKYYRDECGLPYVQEGQKFIYDTEELEQFLDNRKTNSD